MRLWFHCGLLCRAYCLLSGLLCSKKWKKKLYLFVFSFIFYNMSFPKYQRPWHNSNNYVFLCPLRNIFFLKTGSHCAALWAWISIYRPGWPWTQKSSCLCILVLELKACGTMPTCLSSLYPLSSVCVWMCMHAVVCLWRTEDNLSG